MTNEQLIQDMSKEQWIKRWAGSYTFISCSYWAPDYDEILGKVLGVGFKTSLFVHKRGAVTFLLRKNDLENFSKFLATKAESDQGFAIELLTKVKNNTTELMMIMHELEGKIPSLDEYNSFLKVFERHLAYHNFMKKAVDYLSDHVLDVLLPYFKDARLYSEPVYSRTEIFFRKLAETIAEKEGNYTKDLLTCLTQEELELYLQEGTLPEIEILEKRFEASAIYYCNGELKILTGEDVDKIEDAILESNDEVDSNNGELKGITAYPGKVKGICRVVPDPFDVHDFDEGDILVTGMTRPEFVPLMKKAAAIVTDVGGKLCHAALSAREMQLPCIVGTEKATKVLKDGEMIEVDADKGVVRKVK